MKNKVTNSQNIFVSEEEKTINWNEFQSELRKNFGEEIFNSWLKNITLVKEYNDYLVLGVPTRFFRDWIVSRYLDKILELVKNFKLSLNRIEFKINEDQKALKHVDVKFEEVSKITEIKDSILNYNRLNPNLNFENFIKGSSNEVALSYSKKVYFWPLASHGIVLKPSLRSGFKAMPLEPGKMLFFSCEKCIYCFWSVFYKKNTI